MTVSRQVLVPYDELEIRLIEAVAAVAAPVLASAQRQSDGVRRQQGATELSRLAGPAGRRRSSERTSSSSIRTASPRPSCPASRCACATSSSKWARRS